VDSEERSALGADDMDFLRVQGEGICEALWRSLRYRELGDLLDASVYFGEANVRLIVFNRIVEPYGVALRGVPTAFPERHGL
jgi:hypothetical protein